MVKPQTSPKSRPRVSRSINDNYCVSNVAGVKNSVHVSGKKQVLNPSPVIKKSETVVLHVNSFVNPNYYPLVALCRELGWLVNQEKSELDPKQVFNFVGYQFDLREGKVRPTPEHWQTLTDKILSIVSGPVCPVRQFMSLIGLLTATEKQVHLGRLHMRPIHWHLKNNWRVPESLEKVIPIPRSLHPHLKWWLEESNVLPGQPLHPLKHALQIFTDVSKEGWGAHLNESTARGTWSVPESKLDINHLELKAVFLALKEFQDLCSKNIVLVATDNTIDSGCLYQQRRGSLCALLWRILSPAG